MRFPGPVRRLDVREIRERPAFDALATEWDALAAKCQDRAGPFLRHGFVSAWLDAFWRERRWAALWARDAALVVTEERARVGGLPARVVRAASNVHSCRLDVPRTGSAGLGALWAHLRERMSWDVLVFQDLIDGGAAERELSALAEADRMPVGRWASNRSPYLDLTGGWDAVLAKLDGKFRRDVARRKRKLQEEKGEVRFLRLTGGPVMSRWLETGFALEAAAWKGANGSAITSASETVDFYRRVAAHGERTGTLSLLYLLVGEKPVAFQLCLEENGWLGILKPGFDPEYRAFAPGRLILAESIQEFIGRGGAELDFLGPDMDWKRDWTPRYRPHVWWYAFRPGLAGRLRHALKFRAIPWARRSWERAK